MLNIDDPCRQISIILSDSDPQRPRGLLDPDQLGGYGSERPKTVEKDQKH